MKRHGAGVVGNGDYTNLCMVHATKKPGPCITNVFATRRKNFSQWHRSFQRKLLSHWLKFLRHVAIKLVIQCPSHDTVFSSLLGCHRVNINGVMDISVKNQSAIICVLGLCTFPPMVYINSEYLYVMNISLNDDMPSLKGTDVSLSKYFVIKHYAFNLTWADYFIYMTAVTILPKMYKTNIFYTSVMLIVGVRLNKRQAHCWTTTLLGTANYCSCTFVRGNELRYLCVQQIPCHIQWIRSWRILCVIHIMMAVINSSTPSPTPTLSRMGVTIDSDSNN